MRIAKIVTPLMLAATLAFGSAQGQETDESDGASATPAENSRPAPNGDRPHRQSMSDEERAAVRERYENMSEEDKQAMRDKRAERRARWQSMSEEDREAAREKFQQHRADRPRPEGRGRPEAAPDGA